MSMNLKGRNIEFIVKAGARSSVVISIADASGVAKNLSDTGTYSNRSTGEISYLLSAADTAITNAGIWEGEVELLNSSGIMTEQSETFNFTIEESY